MVSNLSTMPCIVGLFSGLLCQQLIARLVTSLGSVGIGPGRIPSFTAIVNTCWCTVLLCLSSVSVYGLLQVKTSNNETPKLKTSIFSS